MPPGGSRAAAIGQPEGGMFTGAAIAVGRIELLLVIVAPAVLADVRECQLTVAAYQARFGKSIVLLAQDHRGSPRYFGPARLMPMVAAIPFELIPWRQLYYQAPVPWRLPIPPDPPASPTAASLALSLTGEHQRSGRVPAATPPVGVTVVHRRPGRDRSGVTLELPVPRVPPTAPPRSPGFDGAGGADDEDCNHDTVEHPTLPLDPGDLVEIPRWS